MKDFQNRLHRGRRFRGRIVGCLSLFLVFVVDCPAARVALGAPPEESFINVRNRDGYIHSYVHRSSEQRFPPETTRSNG